MKNTIYLILALIYTFPLLGQDGFVFEKKVNKVSIPFKLINNLIFIPIKVNGVELNFLLDSGVDETILFSIEDKENISFFNAEKIFLRGLGSEESVEGLKSTHNVLEVKGLKSTNHLLYIVLDQKFNLSSHVGIPINGIIGCNFFKNNLVEINYAKKRIFVYYHKTRNKQKIENKFQKVSITIEKSKPYVNGTVTIDKNEIPLKLLLDIGNSNAVWLFQNSSNKIQIPTKNFEDYLGQGFSGEIFGKRAIVSKFSISNFEFSNPIVAFPDSSSTKNVKMVLNRSGSVGSEILKRFSLVFDYSNQVLYLRKNSDYHSPFSYNKCGIEIQHMGYQWISETIRLENVPLSQNSLSSRETTIANDFKYKLQLKPVYIISNIRKNSLAALTGLKKEDVIVSINKTPAYQYSLNKINLLLRPDEDKWITFEVDRNGQIHIFKFLAQNEL